VGFRCDAKKAFPFNGFYPHMGESHFFAVKDEPGPDLPKGKRSKRTDAGWFCWRGNGTKIERGTGGKKQKAEKAECRSYSSTK
jgi:hypothetical protein